MQTAKFKVLEDAERRAERKSERRKKKNKPLMKVSGGDVKRILKIKKDKSI